MSSVSRPEGIVDVNIPQFGKRRPEGVGLFLGGLGLKDKEIKLRKKTTRKTKRQRVSGQQKLLIPAFSSMVSKYDNTKKISRLISPAEDSERNWNYHQSLRTV